MQPHQNTKPIIIDNKNDKDLLDQNKKELEDFFSLKNKKTQMTLSLSVLALLVFVFVSNTLPFNSKIFQQLYPKPASYATVATPQTKGFLYLNSPDKLVIGTPAKIRLLAKLDQPQVNTFVAKINFDPKLLNFTQAEAVNTNTVTITSQKIDSKNGTISIAGRIEKVDLTDNSMPLVQFTVKPLKAGLTTLTFENPSLFNTPDSTNLNSEVNNLSVEIFAK